MTTILEAKPSSDDGMKINLRGHMTICILGIWYYEDVPTPVAGNVRSSCGHCGKNDTVEGHDGCLGTIPNIMNACCGHGNPREAYIQHWDSTVVQDWTNLMPSCPNRGEGLLT